jgi:FlaA1/EpsC-like NDP-sugar epimerase
MWSLVLLIAILNVKMVIDQMPILDVLEVSSSSSGDGTKYPEVRFLNYNDRKRILITGGSGFVGSHLVDKLMLQGHEVIVADNFFTGR